MNINCPACEGEIQISQDFFGEGLACPHCEHLFQLTADGQVTEYEEPVNVGGSNNKKTAIIASVIAVVAIGGFAALLMSGDDPAPQATNTPPKPAAQQPADNSSTEPAEADPLAAMNAASPMGSAPAMDASPGVRLEPKPPVEIPDTPDGAVNAVVQALADGNPRGFWDALPPSYQNDVNSLVQESADAVDPVMWDKGFRLTTRLAGVLRDKKEFIFATPMMAGVPQKDQAMANWDSVLSLVDTIISSDISSRDRLKQFDGGHFLATTGAGLMANLSALSSLTPEDKWTASMDVLRGAQAKLLSENNGVATVEVTAKDTNQVSKFVQVENRWVPEDLAKDWSKNITEARKSMEKMKAEREQTSMGATMVMGMVEGVLSQFENAGTQEEFNAAVMQVMQMAGGMGGGMGPGGPGMQGQFPPPGMQSNGQFPPPGGQKGGRGKKRPQQ